MTLLALMLMVGLVGAGTFAFFSDTEASTGNTFAAGTLNLTVDGVNDPLPVKFTLPALAPGSSGTITYDLDNVGTIAGFVDIQAVSVVNAAGTTPESEGVLPAADLGELGANVDVTVTIGGVSVYTGTLNGFIGDHDDSVALAAGGTADLVIAWSIPTTVGNVIQGDTATVGMTIELAQTAAQ